MERPVDPYYNGYSGGGDGDAAFIALFGAFAFVGFIFAVAIYVINAIFLMKLLKNTGHRTPGSAWVPIWNTASLFQIGGIKQPWIWVAVLFGANLIASFIPVIGFIVSLAVVVAAVMLMVWVAKGVQAGLGINSVGGIVLAVLIPLAWIIWMAIASGKRSYDRNAALVEGGSLPLNWFGDSDRLAPFGAVATSSYGAYNQAYQPYGTNGQQGYAQPQNGQYYAAPQSQTPSTSETPQPSAQPSNWASSENAQSGEETELPQIPSEPHYESSPAPRETDEGGDYDKDGGRL